MITVAFLAFLACICVARGQMTQEPSAQCIAANSTLMADSNCYNAYQAFLLGVGLGSSIDQSIFDQVCMEGTCRSEILDFQNSCAGLEEVRVPSCSARQRDTAVSALLAILCCAHA